MQKVTAEDHERIANQYNDAGRAMVHAFGQDDAMTKDLKRIENRYWKFAGTGTDDANLKARAMRDRLRQIADAINHDLRQFDNE